MLKSPRLGSARNSATRGKLWAQLIRVNQSSSSERHLPYKITQRYLQPDTDKFAPLKPQPDRLVLNLPIPNGWKAELAWVVDYVAPQASLPTHKQSPIQVAGSAQANQRWF